MIQLEPCFHPQHLRKSSRWHTPTPTPIIPTWEVGQDYETSRSATQQVRGQSGLSIVSESIVSETCGYLTNAHIVVTIYKALHKVLYNLFSHEQNPILSTSN